MDMKWIRKNLMRLLLVCCLTLGAVPAVPVENTVVMTAEAATYSKTTIKAVQKKLNEEGYDCGTPDGIAGKATKVAIKKYQKEENLKVTGTINKTLLKSMGIKGTYAKNSTSSDKKKETTVYITKTGSKYHRGNCRYLKQSKIAISLEDAKKNYEPCSVCNP